MSDYYQQDDIFKLWVRRNPVALKELRGRMRGARAFIVLTLYVVLMSAFAMLLYGIYAAAQTISVSGSGGAIGKLIFAGVLAIELFLVCFISPAFTAGAISGEKERQTFNLLRTTLLPARRIITGKLLSALAYIVLLLFVAVPLQSLAFLMGGVSVPELLLSIHILLMTAICYAAAGIFFSTIAKRTLSASVMTYAFALVVTVVLPILTALLYSIASAYSGDSPALHAVMYYAAYGVGSTNPIASAILTEVALLQQSAAFLLSVNVVGGGSIPVIAPWIIQTMLYLLASVAFVTLSVRQIHKIPEDETA